MLSRLYRVGLIVGSAWIWLGGAASGNRMLLQCLLLAAFPAAMFLDSLLLFGLRSSSFPAMWRAFLGSKRGGVVTLLVVLLVVVWLHPKNDSPHRWMMASLCVIAPLLLVLQPASILVLGASDPTTGTLIGALSALFPHRAIALVDESKSGFVIPGFSPFTDSLRTFSQAQWRKTVDDLIDVVPCVLMNAQTPSRYTLDEALVILGDERRLRKTVFVTCSDGTAPVLAAVGVDVNTPGINVVKPAALVSFLQEHLPAFARSRDVDRRDSPGSQRP
jgi:hypothetical protein